MAIYNMHRLNTYLHTYIMYICIYSSTLSAMSHCQSEQPFYQSRKKHTSNSVNYDLEAVREPQVQPTNIASGNDADADATTTTTSATRAAAEAAAALLCQLKRLGYEANGEVDADVLLQRPLTLLLHLLKCDSKLLIYILDVLYEPNQNTNMDARSQTVDI